MRNNKHIQSFNEHQENLNISDVSDSSKNQIVLRNGVGEVVLDYCKLIDSGDLEKAKEYLKVWIGDDYTRKKNIIFTLEWFKRSKELIKTTKRLLDEI